MDEKTKLPKTIVKALEKHHSKFDVKLSNIRIFMDTYSHVNLLELLICQKVKVKNLI